MNRLTFILPIVLCALFSACGGKNKTTVDTIPDSAAIEESESMANEGEREGPVYYITQDSIGPIVIGMSVNQIPQHIPGLYSSKESGSIPDAQSVIFIYEEDEEFIAYDFGEARIDVINLVGDRIKVKGINGDFGMGDSFRNVLELPGVKAEWVDFDNSGMWHWIWEGLWFAPSPENLGAELSSKLYSAERTPEKDDFPETVNIGFIGTGLPF